MNSTGYVYDQSNKSCEVEIGKSSVKDESCVESRVKKCIRELLENDDPFEVHIELSKSSEPLGSIEEKCKIVKKHFERIFHRNEYKNEKQAEEELKNKSLSNKRRILRKFTDSSQEDEIFNRDLCEIPLKLREEISHCKQVLINLIDRDTPIASSKIYGYLEILYDCNLLKIHSDPICLFIQEEESKALFEDVIKLTSMANTYKTYILRIFLALETNDRNTIADLTREIESENLLSKAY